MGKLKPKMMGNLRFGIFSMPSATLNIAHSVGALGQTAEFFPEPENLGSAV